MGSSSLGSTDSLLPRADEQQIALTRDFSLIQRRRGHRYSVDDMLVAHLAVTFLRAAGRERSTERVLDLGCGLGSVLLISAWALPASRFVGLEVLDEHVAAARRNVALNACGDRVEIVAGDLRDEALLSSLGCFDLVTGSPPYFAVGRGTPPADPARAAAHVELRGGIEDYAQAARRVLRPRGLFVACAGAPVPARATSALEAAGLRVLFSQVVVPRVGKAPFLSLVVGTPASSVPAELPVPSRVDADPLVLREADGRRSPQQIAIREWTGIPCPRG